MNNRSYGYSNSRKNVSVGGAYRPDSPSLFEFFESFFYEIKPFLYITVAVWALHSHRSDAWWIKIACLGIMVFSFLTLFSRLNYRGYLE